MLKANFTRASVAYLKDGTQVASGVPRFEWGRFGTPSFVGEHNNKAIMVEEGTTNLLTAPNDYTNASWIKSSLTVTGDKLAPTDINGNIKQAYNSNPQNVTFTFSVELRADAAHNATVKLQNAANSEYIDMLAGVTTEWKKFTVTKSFTLSDTGILGIIWPGKYSGTTDYVYARNMQIEAKPYATSFIDGTRVIERLNVPAPNMSPTAGTIEVVVDVNAAAKRVRDASTFPMVFAMWQDGVTAPDTGGYLALMHHGTDAKWRFAAKKKSTAASIYIDVLDNLTPDGFNTFTVKWDQSNGAKLFINGVYAGATIAPAYLPDNFYSQFEIGHASNSTTGNLNTTFDSVRLSNIARTDAEILTSYQSSRAREL